MTSRRVLLIAFEDWYSTARLPHMLRSAGFEVGILSEAGNFAAQSRHIAHRFALDVPATTQGKLRSVLAAIDQFEPELLVPGDERAVRLLHFLDETQQTPALERLLRRSLGPSESSRHVGERIWMRALASRLGIPGPAYERINTSREAIVFASRHGWPVFLKRDHTYGGQGVACCADAAAVRTAYKSFSRGHRLWSSHGLWRRARRWTGSLTRRVNPFAQPAGTQGISVEAAVAGQPAFYTGVALDGRMLAGVAAEVEIFHPPPAGPSTRIRLRHDGEMEGMAGRLVEALGHSGFFGLDFIRQPNGRLAFLEFNGRPTTGAHLGVLMSADLGMALFAALTGKAVPEPQRATEARVALFPQDWIRAPRANDRTGWHLDIPRDDPALLAALVRRLPEKVDRAGIEECRAMAGSWLSPEALPMGRHH
jgi:hypothetical protein